MINAKNALSITYSAVRDQVQQLIKLCNEKVIEAAREGLRAISVKVNWKEYGLNVCLFVLEELKQQGFDASIENGVECRYIVICW